MSRTDADTLWFATQQRGMTSEPQRLMLRGIDFEVRFVSVNRKCYDNMPTPTALIYANGKRISRAKAFAMLEG